MASTRCLFFALSILLVHSALFPNLAVAQAPSSTETDEDLPGITYPIFILYDVNPELRAVADADGLIMASLLRNRIAPSRLAEVTTFTWRQQPYSTEDILQAMKDLNLRPQDTLVCLYVGLTRTVSRTGEADQELLQIGPTDEIDRVELLTQMRALNPRFAALIVDDCSYAVPSDSEEVYLELPRQETNVVSELLESELGYDNICLNSGRGIFTVRREEIEGSEPRILSDGSVFMREFNKACLTSELGTRDQLNWSDMRQWLQNRVPEAVDRLTTNTQLSNKNASGERVELEHLPDVELPSAFFFRDR